MRTLVQPGPVSAERIESIRSRCERRALRLEAGLPLAEAITRPLVLAGAAASVLRIEGLVLDPLRCVMPGPADGPAHVAYFSAPRDAGRCRIEQANVTYGHVDGATRLHCHASWREADGTRRGGHLLLDESIVAAPCLAEAWLLHGVGIIAEPDSETNFPLLRPVGLTDVTRSQDEDKHGAIVARIRPNQDFCAAIEILARRHGLRDAVLRGSLGSLVGARFADGREVLDHATEVLVQRGVVRDGVAEIDMMVVDMRGEVHVGRLVPGANAVCITFDVVMEAA